MSVESVVFVIAGSICIVGALGTVLFRNPVHNALSLVATLFGVAVIFIAQDAHLLAAIQVIVYAGAIVVLFLFVIMLLGVDRTEKLGIDPLGGQRPLAVVAAVALLGLSLTVLLAVGSTVTGQEAATGDPGEGAENIAKLGEVLFTEYVLAFEVTAVLLTIAVVGAVMFSRQRKADLIDEEEFPGLEALLAETEDETEDDTEAESEGVEAT
ncbi:MAG: NADH-quinone oxidoreductase subunit J [Actinobacteria bacterium]|nr:MAG: NADH-quinone oxidoreductase subunit J [Actinomycetota bacterium]RIK07914.1 MAG: hypothetical protein DCC48_02900 [Acidobacteriota bacterium]